MQTWSKNIFANFFQPEDELPETKKKEKPASPPDNAEDGLQASLIETVLARRNVMSDNEVVLTT